MRREEKLVRAVQILPVTMPSLPISAQWNDGAHDLAAGSVPPCNIGCLAGQDEQFLTAAFRSFTRVARSLESSYAQLRSEADRLRRELAESNSERARGTTENRRMRVFLNRVMEGLPCGVLVVDAEGRFSKINPEGIRLVGPTESISPDSVSALSAEMRDLLDRAKQETGSDQEVSFCNEDGSRRWLAVRHAWLMGVNEKTSVFILRDTSEHRRLDEMQDRLRRNKALAEISALLAHEIRNPLGSLELFAGLLADAELDDELRSWVLHIQAGLRILGATVSNVLQFQSLPEPERSEVDVQQLLEWACNFCAPLAKQSGITLSVQHCEAGTAISADRHRLEQVLLNLVLNSIRAMPAGGRVGLRAQKSKHELEIAVADTGQGISPEDLPRIFEAGFSRRAGSPGLGLAVCRKIVEQHGGTIAAASTLGRGTTFTLHFPLQMEIVAAGDRHGVQP